MIPKPIVVIYYLPDLLIRSGGNHTPIHEVNEVFANIFPDYHVLAVPSYMSADGSAEAIELKVFYEKDFTHIQYEELKKMIMDSLPQKIEP